MEYFIEYEDHPNDVRAVGLLIISLALLGWAVVLGVGYGIFCLIMHMGAML